MLWPRHTCAFGLADDAENVDHVVLVAIGRVLRVTSTDISDASLPVQLATLLRQIERREQSACLGRRSAKRRRGGAQNMPSASLASSDMRSLSQGGSKVSFTETCPTPAIEATAFSTQAGISPATGQPGEVSVISTATLRASSTSIL